MHVLYFVAKKKEEGDKKEKILPRVGEILENEGFNSNTGYFNNSKADWFVMGGRWSGLLQAIKLDDWKVKAREVIGKKEEDLISIGDIKKHNKELQKLWEKLGGEGLCSWNRDSYSYHNDDAMLLDEELYKALVKVKADYGATEIAIINYNYIEDEKLLSDFLINKDNIGKYWICVVDYHC